MSELNVLSQSLIHLEKTAYFQNLFLPILFKM